MIVSKGIFNYLQMRRGTKLQGRIASLNGKTQLLAGANANDSLHIGESSDRGAIDCGYHIADLEAGRGRGTARLHLIYARRRARLAQESEQAGKDHDRQKEIGNRTGGDECGPRSYLIVM